MFLRIEEAYLQLLTIHTTPPKAAMSNTGMGSKTTFGHINLIIFYYLYYREFFEYRGLLSGDAKKVVMKNQHWFIILSSLVIEQCNTIFVVSAYTYINIVNRAVFFLYYWRFLQTLVFLNSKNTLSNVRIYYNYRNHNVLVQVKFRICLYFFKHSGNTSNLTGPIIIKVSMCINCKSQFTEFTNKRVFFFILSHHM